MATLTRPARSFLVEHDVPIGMRDGTVLRGAAGGLHFTALGSDLAIQLEQVQLEFLAALQHGDADPPGECCEYRIGLIATSQGFRAGHRIRVDIASSNFPCHDRNPGNGSPAAMVTERDFAVADQTLFHEPGRASRITLPVIPRGTGR